MRILDTIDSGAYDMAIAAVFVVLVAVLLVHFVKPTRAELEKFERVEKSIEPTTGLELGVALVVCAAVFAATVAFKFAMGAP